MNRPLVSPAARALVEATIAPADRVLVTGAGGWFGTTALDLLSGTGAEVLATASRARPLKVAGRDVELLAWDGARVAAFAPTHVVDCAFLTRDRVADTPLDDYVAINRGLIDQAVELARMPETRTIVTISSGAAVYPADALLQPLEANPYGHLKREAEERLAAAVDGRAASAVVARAWSVSGAYVRHPRNYALADMILQAAEGRIGIRARGLVRRRYVLADELLAVALSAGARGSAVIDSGGPLVEVGELADAIRLTVNPDAVIERPELDEAVPADGYFTDDLSWQAARAAAGLETLGLAEQIALTARGLGVEPAA